jgi:hypothetical protein
MKPTAHHHLGLGLIIHGAIPPFPHGYTWHGAYLSKGTFSFCFNN